MTGWWRTADELSDEQRSVIYLGLDKSHLIQGPPGSGKTNLLLLRANLLHLSGRPNIAIIVFNKGLQQFLKAGAAGYDFPSGKIHTFVGWMRSLLKTYNVHFEEPDSFRELRERLVGSVTAQLIEERRLRSIIDVILLDEAHDYSPEEIYLFRTLGTDLYAVADSHQKIYAIPDGMDALRGAVDEISILKQHFRVAPEICRVADGIGASLGDGYEAIEPSCNYDVGRYPARVEVLKTSTVESQIDAMLTKLQLQLDAYPEEMIGILCPTNDVLDTAWERIEASPFEPLAVAQGRRGHDAFIAGKRLCVSTIHSAKGLEFRAVHFLAADQLYQALAPNLAYTAVTRAKTTLWVYHSDEMPGFLDAALRIGRPQATPGLAQLFGSDSHGEVG